MRVCMYVCVHTFIWASSVVCRRYNSGFKFLIPSLLSFRGFPDCLKGQALQARLGQNFHCILDSSQLVSQFACLISFSIPCHCFAHALLGKFPACKKYKISGFVEYIHSAVASNTFD